MVFLVPIAVFLALALLVGYQFRRAFGYQAGLISLVIATIPAGAWYALERSHRLVPAPPEDQTASTPIQAQTCMKCHESHYNSWHNTYHRTMTRDAEPENMKADFNDASFTYRGVTSKMTRRGDKFFMNTVDPYWDLDMARQGLTVETAGPPITQEFSVDRIVGSHWFQQLFHRDDFGRYLRLPIVYHIVEKRWIHINGAFLGPDRMFSGRVGVWNETCLYCHNTRPVKNPLTATMDPAAMPAYRTKVSELGISCEACHGSGEAHVRAQQNPASRFFHRYEGGTDPTIVNPAKLTNERSAEVCGRCHGGDMPRYKEWNKSSYADPFLAGRDLKRFWHTAFSEAEQRLYQSGQDSVSHRSMPEALDGRFWGDGTPLTTALEYQGMQLSACYQDGHGKMNCLTCHSMHGSDPNHQVKEGMRTNAACLQCHEQYRDRLAEHTHHAPASIGSNCLNCHMPHQVFSLLDTHRSHRIAIPRVKESLNTGKPHACNLCHLDKSLGWTQDQLVKWYGTKPEPLSDDDRTVASSVLHLAQGDARSRAIFAGAFSSRDAQQTSGREWPAPLLMRTAELERYEAVRYLLHRSLRSLHGNAADDYNYQGTPTERTDQLLRMRAGLEKQALRTDRNRYPHLPLTDAGVFADPAFDRLLKSRKDPDVNVNE